MVWYFILKNKLSLLFGIQTMNSINDQYVNHCLGPREYFTVSRGSPLVIWLSLWSPEENRQLYVLPQISRWVITGILIRLERWDTPVLLVLRPNLSNDIVMMVLIMIRPPSDPTGCKWSHRDLTFHSPPATSSEFQKGKVLGSGKRLSNVMWSCNDAIRAIRASGGDLLSDTEKCGQYPRWWTGKILEETQVYSPEVMNTGGSCRDSILLPCQW